MLSAVTQDLRYAARRVRRQPGFVTAAVVTIGLAVGLATAIYSVSAAVLLRPFPYKEPGRLVTVWKSIENVDIVPFSVAEFSELEQRKDLFHQLAGVERETIDLFAPGIAEHADAYAVTANLFEMLGVQPLLGRTFEPGEDQPGGGRVIVLDEAFWRRAFGGDRTVVGQRVQVAGGPGANGGRETWQVVGVVSSRVRLVYRLPLPVDVYVPRPISAADRQARAGFAPVFFTFGRLSPGVTPSRADGEVRALVTRWSRAYPQMAGPHAGARVTALHEELVGQTRPAFLLLAAAVLVVFLVGCVNVAHLLLSDGMRRREQLFIRLALGCSRGRLMRQLLTEHLLLALPGGLFGLAMAWCAVPLLMRIAPATLPRVEQVRVDLQVALFAFGATVLAAVGSGLAPAWLLARSNTAAPATVIAPRRVSRSVLIAFESALVLALLASGSLIADGLWRLGHLDLGFTAKDALVFQVSLPKRLSPDNRSRAFEEDLLSRIRRVGITGIAASSNLPFANGALYPVSLSTGGQDYSPSVVSAVDAGYLAFLGVPLRAGRMFDTEDRGAGVAVVNQALARRFTGGRAVGQRIRIGGDEWREVVGVAGDITEVGQIRARLIKLPGFTRLTLPAVYVPSGTLGDPLRYLLVRGSTPIEDVARTVRREVHATDPDVTVRVLGTFDERVASVGADKRLYASLVLTFAAVALGLAAVGLYAVLSQSVAQRTREIGVRAALGARPAQIRSTVARGVLAPVALGIASGLAVAAALGRLLRSFLFEVSPTDPFVLASVTLMMLAVAALAAWLPARRATRIDPASALRCE